MSLFSGPNTSTRRVENIDQFVDETEGFFQVANHFQVSSDLVLGLAKHHFLLSEAKYYAKSQVYRVSFIHYQPPPENSRCGGKGVVLETHIKFQMLPSGEWNFLEGHEGYYDALERGGWTRVMRDDYPETEEKRDNAVTRARQHIGDGDYSLFKNNCEHFVTRMLTGEGISYQVRQALKKGSKISSSSGVSSSALVSK